MAAIAITETFKLPVGNLWMVGGQTAALSGGAADEWLARNDLGLDEILGGTICPLGATKGSVNVVFNAQGTGVAAGTNKGDFGIESDVAAAHFFLVIGRGNRRVSNRASSA